MMLYHRTAEQRKGDFWGAREFEEYVAEQLAPCHTRFDRNDQVDIWIPALFLDVKEKRQKLTPRWHLLDGVPEDRLFVLDELSTRKLMEYWPSGYFLLRDVPGGDRLFLAACFELAVVNRARVQRVGKAKLIVDLADFRQIDTVTEVIEIARADQLALPWKYSGALGAQEVRQV